MSVILNSTVDCSPKKLPVRILRLEESARAGDSAALEKLKEELRLAWIKESKERTRVRRTRQRIFERTHAFHRTLIGSEVIGSDWIGIDASMRNAYGIKEICDLLYSILSHTHSSDGSSCLVVKAGITHDNPDYKKFEELSDRLEKLLRESSPIAGNYNEIVEWEHWVMKHYNLEVGDKRVSEERWKWYTEGKAKQEERKAALEKMGKEIRGICKELQAPVCRLLEPVMKEARKMGENVERWWETMPIEYVDTCKDVNVGNLGLVRHRIVLFANFLTIEDARKYLSRQYGTLMKPRLVAETEACDRARALERMVCYLDSL